MNRSTAYSLVIVSLLVSATIVSAQEEPPDKAVVVDAPAVALIDVRVIDGTGQPPVDHQTIVISNGKIAAVGKSGAVSIPEDAQRLEMTGRSVVPGLVMLHEHINYFSGVAIWHSQPLTFPSLYLAAGVTSLRTAGTESPQVDLNLKRRIDTGDAIGPKIHLTGPLFNGPAGGFLGDYVLNTVDEATRAVDYWASLGFTSFKVYTDIAPEVLKAVVDAAHAKGLTVAGHLASVPCGDAASFGIDTIEHAFNSCSELGQERLEPSDPRVQTLIQHLVAEGVVLVSTPMDTSQPLSEEELDVLHPQAREIYLRNKLNPPPWWPGPEHERSRRALERAFVEAGGRLGVGADPGNTGIIAGFANHRALGLLVEAGWTPLEVLRLVTSNNAEILGVGDQVGRIAEGFAADLMLIPGDPTEDIGKLSGVEMVFKDGVGYDPAELKARVKGRVGWH